MTKTTTTTAVAPPAATKANQKAVRARTRPTKAVAKPTEQSSNLHEPLSTGPNYTLESQNLIVEMNRLRDNATAEIASIEAEQRSIHERAQRDMQTIADRAKAEIEARGTRIVDLKRSIALVDGGLANDPGLQPTPQTEVQTDPPSSDEHEGGEQ